ncbi:kinase-like protein [Artomyces pyxidatus]|uniref:Kinase-like protein n=1 Tax=Artomyces pyxidatus TaxID=48021 RepID=A0ACB8TEH4_9AGAM|nr:kinase-like protein [Artomyces pyxidatus]
MTDNSLRQREPTDTSAPAQRPGPFETLHAHELGWRNQQRYLESRGYMLRPRLRPGWVPSWKTSGKRPMHSEDSYSLPVRPLLVDATRMSDGKLVYIKRIHTGDQESTIAQMLLSGNLRDDPRNHSVPILEIFPDTNHEGYSFMVMPFLREMDRPPFSNVGEIVDFADQILEGLAFMHEQNVAHRDCSPKNILMDGDAMFPLGFHPVLDLFLPDATTPAIYSLVPRSVAGVRYYFVDYGLSSYIPPGQPRLVVGLEGRDEEVPELSEDVPYDPFKVDIFSIGNIFRHEFHEKFSNVEFFLPIIELMMQAEPTRRPSAAEALHRWQTIRRGVSALHRSWRPKPRDEGIIIRAVLDVMNIFRSCIQLSKWLAGR